VARAARSRRVSGPPLAEPPRGGDKERILRTANELAIAGTVFLALGMTAAVFLIAVILFRAWWAALTTAVVAGAFAWFWYGLPLLRR
jgi:VIT1/CCC1 family predicted Fe2+/Mn2+ transporter